MEQIHAHRDQTTRDFHNKIDSRRKKICERQRS
eukprot:COSAG05_NODE_16783_length_339_cov_0.641667_2_plen_32_part_01